MATGASKAKREAKKKAAKAYYDALSKTEPIEIGKKIDTAGARSLDDEMQGSMSLSSKMIARKADNLGRKINAVKPQVQGDMESFNHRLDELSRQMKGETIKKYEVFDRPQSSGIGWDAIGNLNSKSLGVFDDQEAAFSAASTAKAENDKAIKNPMAGSAVGGIPGYANTNPGQESSFIKDASLTPVSENYRQLDANEKAYKDLEDISKNIKSKADASGLSKFTQQYASLAEKLQGSLKRDQNNVVAATPNPTGLLASADVINPNASPVSQL